MADYTISLVTIEEKILESFWIDVDTAIQEIMKRQLKVKAQDLIFESSSEKDPRKMTNAELKAELVTYQDELPTFCERPENIGNPDCQDSSSGS